MAILCGGLWDFYPLPNAQGRLELIARQKGGFVGHDVSLTQREKSSLGQAHVVHRSYRFAGHDFFLTVIDGTRDRHAVHDPRYCFQGAGWRLAEQRPFPIAGGEATWLRFTQSQNQAEAVFWFSDGVSRYSSVPRYWWQTTLRRLTLGRSGAEPVMVVLQSYGSDPPDWPTLAQKLVGLFEL